MMKDLEKKISRFLKSQIPLIVLAEVCHLRFNGDRIEKNMDRLLSEQNESLSFEETTMEIEMVSDPVIQQVGLDMKKRKVKELLFKFTQTHMFGISGMSGSGKTTLAIELSRDDGVRGLFKNKVLFLTVSRSPNFEKLESCIRGFVNDGVQQRKLVILDDVWTRESLDRYLSMPKYILETFAAIADSSTQNMGFLYGWVTENGKQVCTVVIVPQWGTHQQVNIPATLPEHYLLKQLEPLGWRRSQPTEELFELTPYDLKFHARFEKDWDREHYVIATCSVAPHPFSIAMYKVKKSGYEWASSDSDVSIPAGSSNLYQRVKTLTPSHGYQKPQDELYDL